MKILAAAVFLAGFLLTGCRQEEKPEAFLWNGSPLTPLMAPPDSNEANRMGPIPPIRRLVLRLESGDLDLYEYAGELPAYAVFQTLASPRECASGWAVTETMGTVFRKGRWIGKLPETLRLDLEGLRQSLQIPEESEWGQPPALFASLLHSERLAGSERVLWREFLGLQPPAPVLAVELDCHGDSAWLYVSPGMPESFTAKLAEIGFEVKEAGRQKSVLSTGKGTLPLRMEFLPEGMTGIEGCFDSLLTERWVESQIKALKSQKKGIMRENWPNFN